MKPVNLNAFDHSVRVFEHIPEYGVSMEQIMEPSYWVHVARILRPGYEIVVTAPDMSWRGRIMVRGVNSNEVYLGLMSFVSFVDAKDDASFGNYEIKWRGPKARFGVVRKDDGTVIKDGFEVREAAEKWLKENILNMVKAA